MFALLPIFGLVMFQLRKPSLIAISHLILKSWHKNYVFFSFFFQKRESIKVSVHFVDVKSYLLWFERRFNPDRSNLFNVLMLNWKHYYLIKNNTLNHLFVTKKKNHKITLGYYFSVKHNLCSGYFRCKSENILQI